MDVSQARALIAAHLENAVALAGGMATDGEVDPDGKREFVKRTRAIEQLEFSLRRGLTACSRLQKHIDKLESTTATD
jgi:hypothetical protein